MNLASLFFHAIKFGGQILAGVDHLLNVLHVFLFDFLLIFCIALHIAYSPLAF